MASERRSGLRRTLALAACAALLLAARVYPDEQQALAMAFADATRIETRQLVLDEAARERLSRRLDRPVRDHLVEVHVAYRDGSVLGCGLVLEERGKTLPFRFLVSITPAGRVDQVLLLAFREPRGYEIERASFRAQYQGKTLSDPIRRGADIENLTGATLSVDALSRGVRRALAIHEEIAPRLAAEPEPPRHGG
jgi:Na+-translocating ferredoxin:NAD+ oxidoreductase RnfG subunit